MSEDLLSRLYIGRSAKNVDDKNRLGIPSEFRKTFETRNKDSNELWIVAASRDGNNYLACFDRDRFEELQNTIEGAWVEASKIDDQKRIVLAEWQKNYAHAEREVMIAGSPDMQNFEIWHPDSFKRGYSKKNGWEYKSINSE